MNKKQIIVLVIAALVFFLKRKQDNAAPKASNTVGDLTIGHLGAEVSVAEAPSFVKEHNYNVSPIGRAGLYFGEHTRLDLGRQGSRDYWWITKETATVITGFWSTTKPSGI